ncbi:hypothetical protein BR93DRAFT_931432 [Coniochaeta sp. PMI_546]|nr:hypothetical protein BR93DRAFT_931432 [Coniochaeta sp. PMI_546]
MSRVVALSGVWAGRLGEIMLVGGFTLLAGERDHGVWMMGENEVEGWFRGVRDMVSWGILVMDWRDDTQATHVFFDLWRPRISGSNLL